MSVDFSNLECIVDVSSNQGFPSEFASLPLASPTLSEDFLSVFGSGSALDNADLSSYNTSSSLAAFLPQLKQEEEDIIMAESTSFDPSSLETLTAQVKYNSEQEEWLRRFEEQQSPQQHSQERQDLFAFSNGVQIKQELADQDQHEEEKEEEEDNEVNYETDDEEDEKERLLLAAVNKEKPSRDEFGYNVARVYRPYVPELIAGTKTHAEVAKVLSEALPLWRRKFKPDFMTKIYRGKILQKYLGAIQAPQKRTKASVTGNEFDRINRDERKRDEIKNRWIKSGRDISAANLAKETGISRPVAHRLVREFQREYEQQHH